MLNAPKARVVRDGVPESVGLSQVVADDLLELQPGFQVVVDGEVVQSGGLEIDESLLTGESEPIDKGRGDEVLSGSFVVAGSGYFRATRIGAESYSSKLADEARQFKLAPSDLRRGIDKVLRLAAPHHPAARRSCFFRLFNSDEVKEVAGDDRWQRGPRRHRRRVRLDGARRPGAPRRASRSSPARSRSLAARRSPRSSPRSSCSPGSTRSASTRPARSRPARSRSAASSPSTAIRTSSSAALGAMGAADPNPNPTLAAIATHFSAPAGWTLDASTPFSSARKWAGAHFAEHGSFYLGAPDILLDDDDDRDARLVSPSMPSRASGCCSSLVPTARTTASRFRRDVSPWRWCCSRTRSDPIAGEILAYFLEQDVTLKVISGDHPRTVAAVAQRVGVPGAERAATTPASSPTTPSARRRARGALGVRPGDAAPEAGDGRRAAVTRSRRRDDRRRRQRRARAQGRRHGHRDGRGLGGIAAPSRSSCCSTTSTPRCRWCSPRAGVSSTTSSASPTSSSPSRRTPSSLALLVGRLRRPLPVPAAPLHAHRLVQHRHPGFLPRARPERRPRAAELPRPRAAVLDPGRPRGRRVDLRGLRRRRVPTTACRSSRNAPPPPSRCWRPGS